MLTGINRSLALNDTNAFYQYICVGKYLCLCASLFVFLGFFVFCFGKDIYTVHVCLQRKVNQHLFDAFIQRNDNNY